MATDQSTPSGERPTAPLPPGPGKFRWGQLACWLPVAAVLGVLAAWAAEATQAVFAPLFIFPIVVGVVLGGLIVLLMRACRVGHRPTILGGALLAIGLTVIGQHYISYCRTLRPPDDSDALPAAQVLFPELHPASFVEYMRQQVERGRPVGRGHRRVTGGWAWGSWILDALLVLIPAVVLTVTAARLPYCNRCQRWYHTIRGKRIELSRARRLAEVAGLSDFGEPNAKSLRYRLVACDGDCGPLGLALFWSDAKGDFSSGYIWLDPEQRSRVLEIVFK